MPNEPDDPVRAEEAIEGSHRQDDRGEHRPEDLAIDDARGILASAGRVNRDDRASGGRIRCGVEAAVLIENRARENCRRGSGQIHRHGRTGIAVHRHDHLHRGFGSQPGIGREPRWDLKINLPGIAVQYVRRCTVKRHLHRTPAKIGSEHRRQGSRDQHRNFRVCRVPNRLNRRLRRRGSRYQQADRNLLRAGQRPRIDGDRRLDSSPAREI